VRTDDHRVGQQGQEVRRANQLTGVRAQGVDLGEEDLVGAAQCLDRHRGRDVHELHERLTVGERENQLSEHPVRAVDEGQSLLLGQDHRVRPFTRSASAAPRR